jgi:hypothetical protein
MNAIVARELFPVWTCRVYLDDSVPDHVQTRLRAAGADVIQVDEQTRRTLPGTMWRFLVMDDPTVDRFLLRDADSLLSEREAAAVAEWIDSGQLFHHMRDYFTHTELLLAGMWGGCTGVFPAIRPLMAAYMAEHPGPSRFSDQHFLRETLWPTVRQSILNHDELFGFHNPKPFPQHPPIRWKTQHFHVGSNAGYQRVAGPSSLADGAHQTIRLREQGGSEINYVAFVKDGEWTLTLPFFVVETLRSGHLEIEISPEDRIAN